jgi:hypothetical protein
MKDLTAKTIGAFGATSILTYAGLQYYAMQSAGQRNYFDHMRYTIQSLWDPSAQYFVDSFRGQYEALSALGAPGGLIAVGLGAAAAVAVWGFAGDKSQSDVKSYKIKQDRNETYRRGAKMLSAQQVAWDLKKSKDPVSPVVLGGVPITENAMTRHFLIAGTTGSGKSVLFQNFLDAEERTARGFIIDNGYGLLQRYYSSKRGDVILNPLDQRCADWSPFAELEGPEDATMIACSLIPERGEGPGSEWVSYAQALCSCLLRRLGETGVATNREFYRLATSASVEELQPILAGTEAASMLDKGADKMFGGARGIMNVQLRGFDQLDPDAGKDGFSIRKLVLDSRGWLFLPYLDSQRKYLKNLIASWADISILAAMEKESKDRKFFVLDEFDSLGRIGSVRDDLLSKGRKYGAVALIGVQTLSQIRDRYGKDGAGAILGNCSTWVSFKTPCTEMGEEISKRIGEQEIERKVESSSAGKTRGKTRTANEGQSIQNQIVKSRLVMPEEIRTLANCEGFLMSAEGQICPIHLDYPAARAARAEGFIRKSGAVRIEEKMIETEVGFE